MPRDFGALGNILEAVKVLLLVVACLLVKWLDADSGGSAGLFVERHVNDALFDAFRVLVGQIFGDTLEERAPIRRRNGLRRECSGD